MDEAQNPFVFVVPPKDEGISLGRVLRDRMGLSRTLVVKLKRLEQGILLNGERAFTNAVVHAGDRVEVRLPEDSPDSLLPEPIPIDILHEDDHLLVVNKPAGMVVHPTHGHYTGTLANGVAHYWREKGLSLRFRPAHRLDQFTSGVLAIAKNAYVHQQIAEQMKKNRVEKQYSAFVFGEPDPPDGHVEGPIGRSDDNPHMRIVRPDGAPSLTRYRTVENYGIAAWVCVFPETGRTHQIRVHMRHIGHPLLGDPLYAADRIPPEGVTIGRQALHAEMLALDHPVTGKRIRFEAPLPEDLVELCNLLRDSRVERMQGC